MAKMLEGVKVVEVSMWAFVPAAGATLADWGADVVKIEHPTGDPVRGLNYAGIEPGFKGFTFMYELYNRGKRSVALDLGQPGARDILLRLVDEADIFLTSLLPSARRKLGIDVDDIVGRNARIIYAVGTGQGSHGDEADKGGYDSISFWARSGIASAVTPEGHPYPVGMPGGAFGDGLSGTVFAGGIAAALAHRERTGEGTVVDGALLATGMWAMQPGIAGATLKGVDELPKLGRTAMPNPLVNNYRTSDGRFVALCMLQGDRYWPGFCQAAGREDLIDDPRFATNEARAANLEACIAELDALFATKTLAEWREILGRQEGQWDVVKKAAELRDDPQAVANGYVQDVDYGDGRTLTMVASPVQFGRTPPQLRRAPELGEHTDEVLLALGMTMDEIIEAKVAGAVG